MKTCICFFIVASSVLSQTNDCKLNYNVFETGFNLGIKELGSNTWSISKKGALKSSLTLEKEARNEIHSFSLRTNLLCDVIRVETNRDELLGVVPTVTLVFTLKNKDGSNFMSKKNALNKLRELKELLDMGLISTIEYEEKVFCLKKIILS